MRILCIFLLAVLYLVLGEVFGFISDPYKQVFTRRIERIILVIFWPIWFLYMLFEWVFK